MKERFQMSPKDKLFILRAAVIMENDISALLESRPPAHLQVNILCLRDSVMHLLKKGREDMPDVECFPLDCARQAMMDFINNLVQGASENPENMEKYTKLLAEKMGTAPGTDEYAFFDMKTKNFKEDRLRNLVNDPVIVETIFGGEVGKSEKYLDAIIKSLIQSTNSLASAYIAWAEKTKPNKLLPFNCFVEPCFEKYCSPSLLSIVKSLEKEKSNPAVLADSLLDEL
jgi:hypothetical protein